MELWGLVEKRVKKMIKGPIETIIWDEYYLVSAVKKAAALRYTSISS